MSFKVTIEPSGHEFVAAPGETLLDAAERQGINLPYGCRNGLCGSCAATLKDGLVSYPEDLENTGDQPDGQCLTCKATATSDLVLHVGEVESEKEIEVHTLPCIVDEMEQLAHDVMRIYLKLPEGQRLQYLAGQYLDFLLEGDRRRAFSIANAPHSDDRIELHLRHVDGGEFTDHVFNDMKVGEIQRIQAPLGGFYLREDSQRPHIFMAGGTGFAPLKGIIEHAFYIGLDQPIHLFWGVRSERDLYLTKLAEEWASEQATFQFTPVLSEPDEGWQGEKGWVHQAVLKAYPNMSGHDLYMSGPPPMVYAAKDAFFAAGLSEDNMFSDVFEWAKD